DFPGYWNSFLFFTCQSGGQNRNSRWLQKAPRFLLVLVEKVRSSRHNKCRIFHLETLHLAGDEGERIVLADNKCKCVRVTSRIIPSPENPNEDILERHIRIIIPVNSRENISDPTSPVRTKFVYHLSDLCKKCDPVEVELDNQVVTASQSNICDEESETCYAYDRNKCYTNRVPLTYGGQTKIVETALTPDSCYPD
uniref:Joining chain of multimeric IgA and IgM n=1 Tax=Equus caballus TaxID=9796 RepID=A0A9L0TUN1_HORSE